jgi:hypothetical protein
VGDVGSATPLLLDLSSMRRDAQKLFVADFLEELYQAKNAGFPDEGIPADRSPLHLLVDEADISRHKREAQRRRSGRRARSRTSCAAVDSAGSA